jgi:hypothetical protein
MNGYKKFGVQSNYSGNRKRYGTGKYISNKYKSNKAYTRRVNVRRNIKSGETTFKLFENMSIFPSTTSGNCYGFSTLQNYANIASSISTITQWATIASNWSLYRLNGISFRVGKVFNDNIGSMGSAVLPSPPLYVNYYPTVSSQAYSGQVLQGSESSLRVDAYVTGIQKKYISLPKNFSNLTNGIGLGTWNPVLSLANMQGQISVGGTLPSGTPTVTYPSFEIQVVYYVSVCNDKV